MGFIYSMKTVYVIIYSAYGHVEKMAQSIIKGLEKSSVKVKLFQVQETLSQEVLGKMNVKAMPHIPVVTANDLHAADGFMFGFPTRFGMVPAQFKALLDSCGKLWLNGGLSQKFVGTFVSTGSLGFGQEGTHLSLMPFFAHLGMIYVPLGSKCPLLLDLSAAHGGSPYGAGTLASSNGSRTPSELELSIAEFQGQEFGTLLNRMQ